MYHPNEKLPVEVMWIILSRIPSDYLLSRMFVGSLLRFSCDFDTLGKSKMEFLEAVFGREIATEVQQAFLR